MPLRSGKKKDKGGGDRFAVCGRPCVWRSVRTSEGQD
jgi:hypothetical protein